MQSVRHYVANELSEFRQCTAPRATFADTQAVWMHFSGPLVCAKVWTFLEARYDYTHKTLDRPPPTGPRTGAKARATTKHHTCITVSTQPTATHCNLLQLHLAYQRPTNKYQGPLSSGPWGLPCPIFLPRTAPALLRPLRTVHTWHHQTLCHTTLPLTRK